MACNGCQNSPFVNVPFDNLARGWHGFVTVWHFDRLELALVQSVRLVEVYCCCQLWLQIT